MTEGTDWTWGVPNWLSGVADEAAIGSDPAVVVTDWTGRWGRFYCQHLKCYTFVAMLMMAVWLISVCWSERLWMSDVGWFIYFWITLHRIVLYYRDNECASNSHGRNGINTARDPEEYSSEAGNTCLCCNLGLRYCRVLQQLLKYWFNQSRIYLQCFQLQLENLAIIVRGGTYRRLLQARHKVQEFLQTHQNLQNGILMGLEVHTNVGIEMEWLACQTRFWRLICSFIHNVTTKIEK